MRYVNEAAMKLSQFYWYSEAKGNELDMHEDKLKLSIAHTLLVLSELLSN
jgi:hypothetical protein